VIARSRAEQPLGDPQALPPGDPQRRTRVTPTHQSARPFALAPHLRIPDDKAPKQATLTVIYYLASVDHEGSYIVVRSEQPPRSDGLALDAPSALGVGLLRDTNARGVQPGWQRRSHGPAVLLKLEQLLDHIKIPHSRRIRAPRTDVPHDGTRFVGIALVEHRPNEASSGL